MPSSFSFLPLDVSGDGFLEFPEKRRKPRRKKKKILSNSAEKEAPISSLIERSNLEIANEILDLPKGDGFSEFSQKRRKKKKILSNSVEKEAPNTLTVERPNLEIDNEILDLPKGDGFLEFSEKIGKKKNILECSVEKEVPISFSVERSNLEIATEILDLPKGDGFLEFSEKRGGKNKILSNSVEKKVPNTLIVERSNLEIDNEILDLPKADGVLEFCEKRRNSRKKKKNFLSDSVEEQAQTTFIVERSNLENSTESSEIIVDESENPHVLRQRNEQAQTSLTGKRSNLENATESSEITVDNESENPSVLRQRNVKGMDGTKELDENWELSTQEHVSSLSNQGSLDWEKAIEAYPGLLGEESSFKKFPLKYFLAEIKDGISFRSTMSVGIERKRQRVYNTMFHVPVRCERLIDVGFFVCLDTFLSLLTIMPARILIFLLRLIKTRKFQMPNDRELSDFGCLIVLVFGIIALQLTDISLIYHIIRGQGTVKLYVVYNVLEIFDNLLRSFGEDVLQVLFNSLEGLAGCSSGNLIFDVARYILDQIIAIVVFTLHSFVLLAAAITLSTCVIAHNNALLALLISNNFSEIKSNVFKRVSKDNIHSLVCHDIVERFHITAFVLFILTQNILESEGSWFRGFFSNVMLVFMCEVLIDIIKHSFLAKFNEIKPMTYSEFLEDLCKQILDVQPEDGRKNLTFIPLAPACVVIRVLTPVYAAFLPSRPLAWRLLSILAYFSLTYLILVIGKVVVSQALSHFASWYLRQHSERKPHED